MIKAKKFFEAINEITPLELAQSWDNVGHLIGDLEKPVAKVLLCIDLTREVFREAQEGSFDTIICYHPVIWEPLKSITAQSRRGFVYELAHAGINVFSVHTACDAAVGGVNDMLAYAVGIENPKPLGDFVSRHEDSLLLLTVQVPVNQANELSEAIFNAGAGAIGNYSDCSFSHEGTGRFKPLPGSNPVIGDVWALELVREIQIETVVRADKAEAVLDALLHVHPYETPAYSFVNMESVENKYGIGRFGALAAPRNASEIIEDIKELTGAETIGLVGDAGRFVKTAAVCAGSCGSIAMKAVKAGCDMYITGEMKHHEALAAKEAGLLCVCLSHSVSERFMLGRYAELLRGSAGEVEYKLSEKDCDPFVWG
ncbi:MAG: Nif3-like dinuclear metal center hexameric protein [Phycisphaerae bacterium]